MGVKERQERDREAVARAILDAARDLFVAEGYPNVSIRKIAEKIEYSPAAIYSYFPSKDDIFLALAEEGFRMLFASSEERCNPGGSRIEKIRAGFWRVYEFSKAHPEYFALMFLDRAVPRISRDWQRFGFVREMKRHIAELIQERNRRRRLSRRHPSRRASSASCRRRFTAPRSCGSAAVSRRATTPTRSPGTR